MSDELCFLTAHELARKIRERELSALEVMQAHLDRIDRLNPQVNAIVALDRERALAGARAADESPAAGRELGPLHGLPIAHKDLFLTKEFPTTFGSPIYADFRPTADQLIVERIRAGGAIAIGKTNVPEFGAGSQTFNPVYGATRNPYDLNKTCGGSSGGAAVALACGMLPIADGSDTGGSLRNPAAFCNVVGMRPSIGRVPSYPSQSGFSQIHVPGPMARTVADVALLLSAIAGPDSRAPLSLTEPGETFARPLERDFRGVRVAWSRDLGGLPIDPAVTAALAQQRRSFEQLGCIVEEAEPDLHDAPEIFQIMRGWHFELGRGDLLEKYRDRIKDTVVWNIEVGRRLSGPDLAHAEKLRSALFQRMHDFMQPYEFLLLPVTQVPAFDIEQPYVSEINGVQMDTYIDWMRSCSDITVTGHPALAVPGGFTPTGLPVGLQIVGRYRDDFGVLQLGHAFEQASGIWQRRPTL
jgi:amidase